MTVVRTMLAIQLFKSWHDDCCQNYVGKLFECWHDECCSVALLILKSQECQKVNCLSCLLGKLIWSMHVYGQFTKNALSRWVQWMTKYCPTCIAASPVNGVCSTKWICCWCCHKFATHQYFCDDECDQVTRWFLYRQVFILWQQSDNRHHIMIYFLFLCNVLCGFFLW